MQLKMSSLIWHDTTTESGGHMRVIAMDGWIVALQSGDLGVSTFAKFVSHILNIKLSKICLGLSS